MISLHALDDEKDIKYWNFSPLSSPLGASQVCRLALVVTSRASEFPWAAHPRVRASKPQPCSPQPFCLFILLFFFFSGRCSNAVSNYPKFESLLLWHAGFGKRRRNAARWEEKKKPRKKEGEGGTFPSPTRSLMIFVLFSFKSYLKFQPSTVRSARTDLCFNNDAQSPFCWGHGSKTPASGLCSSQCRHAFSPSRPSTPSAFQDKDHFTNLSVQHTVQSVTCICNPNSNR